MSMSTPQKDFATFCRKTKRDSNTIFEVDFGMDFDEHCLCRGRRTSDKRKQWRKCPEPMRKENLYTVSLLYIRGVVESITAILFPLTKKENLYTVSLLYIRGFVGLIIALFVFATKNR